MNCLLYQQHQSEVDILQYGFKRLDLDFIIPIGRVGYMSTCKANSIPKLAELQSSQSNASFNHVLMKHAKAEPRQLLYFKLN